MMYTPPVNKKPVHLVKNYHDVPESQRHAEPLWSQEKIDGVYAYGMCVHGDARIFSRTGKLVKSLKHLEDELANLAAGHKFKPVVAIFEVHVPGWPVNLINGSFSRQSEQFTEAVAHIHDVIPHDDFCAGRCEIPYRLRYAAASIAAQCMKSFELIAIQPTPIECEQDALECAEGWIAYGSEGVVFKRIEGIWIAGKKDVNQMKIKQGVSYDLEVIGMEEGKGKYKGTLGKLLCKWTDGRVVKCSGMTDAQRHEWWDHYWLMTILTFSNC